MSVALCFLVSISVIGLRRPHADSEGDGRGMNESGLCRRVSWFAGTSGGAAALVFRRVSPPRCRVATPVARASAHPLSPLLPLSGTLSPVSVALTGLGFFGEGERRRSWSGADSLSVFFFCSPRDVTHASCFAFLRVGCFNSSTGKSRSSFDQSFVSVRRGRSINRTEVSR